MPDQFEKVLKKLGVYERLKDTHLIRVAPTPPTPPTNNNFVPCRIQGLPLNLSYETRLELSLQLIKYIHRPPSKYIRPISFILNPDGNFKAEPIRMPVNEKPVSYSTRYCIPPSTICDLDSKEQVRRSEKFALGTLLYELNSGQKIFDGQSDNKIQKNYRNGNTFPSLESLSALMQCIIYACWSAEFAHYISMDKFSRYVHDNPVRFGLQVTGVVLSTAAIFAVPILGAAGFSSIGPVAGSAAAGWQASIGVVRAGSLFAFCQSAAMGGAAATAGLASAGVSGAAVALAAAGLPNPSSLREVFIRRFRLRPKKRSRKIREGN